jgi:hypothetical protein
MPYIITVLKPKRSKHGVATSPTGQHFNHEDESEVTVATMNDVLDTVEAIIDDAQDALGEEEGARRYFDPARTAAMALDEEHGGRIDLPDGSIIEVKAS